MFSLPNIEAMEKAAVKKMVAESCLPTPKCENWDAIKKFYNLPDPKRVDNVKSIVKLPVGWTVEIDPNDYFKRNCNIKNKNGEKVGSTFLKTTPYNYYGFINFNSEKLKEMGVL